MKKAINHLDWQSALESREDVYSIGKDFFLTDKLTTNTLFPRAHPSVVDSVIAIICTKGSALGKLNLKRLEVETPCMIIILPGQVIEYEFISEDFEGQCIIMSKRFTESLNIEEGFSAFIAVRNNPCVCLTEKTLKSMQNYFMMMKGAIEATANPNRFEIAKHLTKAFFYGAGYYFHELQNTPVRNRNEQLVDNFIHLIQTHFKKNRNIEFYADKLCLTPKYLSTVIKQASGKPAGEWIDERTILEAKAYLKSTNMTIQQIADDLNFSTQSSFGKYFKRIVGVSPKEYRNNTNL